MFPLTKAFNKMYNPVAYSLNIAKNNCKRTKTGWTTKLPVRRLVIFVNIEEHTCEHPLFMVILQNFGLAYCVPAKDNSKDTLMSMLKDFLENVQQDPRYFGDIEEVWCTDDQIS